MPFCFNKNQVKAFVLGADPTNFSAGGNPAELLYAFGIGQDARYFSKILENLKRIGLHLEDLYIQNLLPEFQDKQTTENKNYEKAAGGNTYAIAAEFDRIDPSKNLKVFLTAEKVYKAVIKEGKIIKQYGTFYNLETDIPIPASDNLLGRPLIPFFRHEDYDLVHWPKYESFLRDLLHT